MDSIFPEVRLGVLAFICECSKTTQPFLPFELDLLLLTIRKNLTLDDGNDLDRFFGYVERILVRVNAALTKQSATKDFASSLHSSPDVQFLRALFSLLQQQLHPVSPSFSNPSVKARDLQVCFYCVVDGLLCQEIV